MNRNHFTFFRSFQESAKKLPESERLRFYEAIIDMSLDGTEQELEGLSSIVWPFVRDVIQYSRKKAAAGSKIQTQSNQNRIKSGTESNQNENKNQSKRKPKKKEEEVEEDYDKERESIKNHEMKKPLKHGMNEKMNGLKFYVQDNIPGSDERFGSKLKAWFTNCTKDEFIDKVEKFQDFYPAQFLREFTDHYLQESHLGGFAIHHQDNFDMETKLRKWWNQPDMQKKYAEVKSHNVKKI